MIGRQIGMRIGLLVAAALVYIPDVSMAAVQPEVRIATGQVSGVSADGVESFKGIPFAAPPVGTLRWRPPAPAPAWTGVRDGSSFGPACPQMSRVRSWAAQTGEDCLTINVWRARSSAPHPLPVMVWIYGGAFLGGHRASRGTTALNSPGTV